VILAKALLPRFGGSAGVWTTRMLFFRTGLQILAVVAVSEGLPSFALSPTSPLGP